MNELELERIRGNLDATRTEKGYYLKPQKVPCTSGKSCGFVDTGCTISMKAQSDLAIFAALASRPEHAAADSGPVCSYLRWTPKRPIRKPLGK